jgi:hypothetical protein
MSAYSRLPLIHFKNEDEVLDLPKTWCDEYKAQWNCWLEHIAEERLRDPSLKSEDVFQIRAEENITHANMAVEHMQRSLRWAMFCHRIKLPCIAQPCVDFSKRLLPFNTDMEKIRILSNYIQFTEDGINDFEDAVGFWAYDGEPYCLPPDYFKTGDSYTRETRYWKAMPKGDALCLLGVCEAEREEAEKVLMELWTKQSREENDKGRQKISVAQESPTPS